MTTTATSQTPALENKPVNLYSDLMVHHMGAALADNIPQGGSDVDEFRTVPLWGVGQRLFLMHDGRTSNLVDAIHAHSSPATPANSTLRTPAYPASEANASASTFFGRSAADQQAVLVFLRSL